MFNSLFDPQHRSSMVSPVSTLDNATHVAIRSAVTLFAAAATFSANEIVFDNPLDYFETAVTILMFFIGLAVTTIFYMVHTIWTL